MGTCWLLQMETMLDLGWNLSAAADKGGRLERGRGQGNSCSGGDKGREEEEEEK